MLKEIITGQLAALVGGEGGVEAGDGEELESSRETSLGEKD